MITNIVSQIDNKEIVLPAIQRDFVWDEDRITQMFDSIMRGYPLGIALLWETYLNIKYREFELDYQIDAKHLYKDNDTKRIKLVLDGQQRLQSLYVSICGSINNKELYFDLISGTKVDDFREVFYTFRFLTKTEAETINAKSKIIRNDIVSKKNEKDDFGSIFVSIKFLLRSSPEERLYLKNHYKTEYSLNDNDLLRLELNINKLLHSLTNDQNILKVSVIDENKPKDSIDRKSESDILEAFVRINRQGIPLSRSDLIFSMLKLNWKESAEELPEFIKTINSGNDLGIDVDFVIRSLFSVSDLGSKFDVDLLRKNSNVNKIKDNYPSTCNAIRSLVDFLQDQCNILNSNIIGGALNLIPFVYYLAKTRDNLVPNSEVLKMKQALYIFGFTRPFSRYADSRIGAFIREELKPLTDKKSEEFPLNSAIWWANYWESYDVFDSKLLQKNKQLTLHLLQGKSGVKVKYERNSPELDHIFPQSILKEKNVDLGLINSYGNFWILAKTKNQNKSNKPPKEYFKDVCDKALEKAIIDKDKLEYKYFKKFVRDREERILVKIKKIVGIKDNSLDFATIWGNEQ